MPYCSNTKCVKSNAYTSNLYCNECGTKAVAKLCGYCGREILGWDKFCGFCGRPAHDAAVSTPETGSK